MNKGYNAVIILSALVFLCVMGVMPSNAQPSPSFYYNFSIDVMPESPTVKDEINVTISFDIASISYIVDFGSIKRIDNQFYVDIDIYVPEIVIWVIGYAENTYRLGRLEEGVYSFNVRISVCDLETGVLLYLDWLGTFFDVTAARSFLLLETDKSVYAWGEEVNITLTNIGDVYVFIGGWPSCLVSTYPALEPVWPRLFAYLAWGLKPGESETWTWNQYNAYNECHAEAGKYVVEFYGSTNASFINKTFFKILLCGDINADDTVNHKDLLLLARAYGSKLGDSNWNEKADLNDDFKVDHEDLLILAANYGKET